MTNAAALGMAMLTMPALAGTPWGPPAGPSGTASFFDWAGGTNSNTNLFESPTLIGNSFQFFPSNFTTSSANGVAGFPATDQMNVTLTAHPNAHFSRIRIDEFGTFLITGIGTVQDSGTMFLTDLNIPFRTASSSLVNNLPPMPAANVGGPWTSSVEIDLDALGGPQWTKLMFQFTNTLQAGSNPGSSSTISKKGVSGPAIVVTVFPSPGSGALLLAGCGMLARRRRR